MTMGKQGMTEQERRCSQRLAEWRRLHARRRLSIERTDKWQPQHDTRLHASAVRIWFIRHVSDAPTTILTLLQVPEFPSGRAAATVEEGSDMWAQAERRCDQRLA